MKFNAGQVVYIKTLSQFQETLKSCCRADLLQGCNNVFFEFYGGNKAVVLDSSGYDGVGIKLCINGGKNHKESVIVSEDHVPYALRAETRVELDNNLFEL